MTQPDPFQQIQPVTRSTTTGNYQWANWVTGEGLDFLNNIVIEQPDFEDDVHVPENFPVVTLIEPEDTDADREDTIDIELEIEATYDPEKVEYYLNGIFIGEDTSSLEEYSIDLDSYDNLPDQTELRIVVIDEVYNRGEITTTLFLD